MLPVVLSTGHRHLCHCLNPLHTGYWMNHQHLYPSDNTKQVIQTHYQHYIQEETIHLLHFPHYHHMIRLHRFLIEHYRIRNSSFSNHNISHGMTHIFSHQSRSVPSFG